MTRIRLIMLSMLAVFAFSAVATATASAACSGTSPEHKCIWEIKETSGGLFEELKTGEEVLVRSVSEPEAAVFKLVQGGHTIECKKIFTITNLIGGKPGTDVADIIRFTECSTNSTTGTCKVKSKGNTPGGTILVTKIKTTLREDESSTGATKHILADRFEQKTRKGIKEFVTLEFGTEEEPVIEPGTRFEHRKLKTLCAGFPGTTEVKGHVDGEVEGEKIKFPSPALKESSLEAFGLEAVLSGTSSLRLEEPGEFRAA